MKFSESWLREWVNPALDNNELCEKLSMAGLEVDGVEPVAESFSGVIVGHVVECNQHPDADKLQVTKVDVGESEHLDIVCGAPNCRKGLKVAVAVVGAVLPGNFKIKKAKLRGQPSFGMLCSFSELGMGDDHSGIIELDDNAPVGQDLREYLLLNDNIIEIDLTPNRADCLGIKGVARELGVLTQTKVNTPDVKQSHATINSARSIHLEAPAACPRYLGRLIKNVDLSKQSPLWLKEKLRRGGVRSIDPVVDVTNYVLLELGHPMHAFDNDKLVGDIHVRLPQKGEKITLLDESNVDILSDTLVIADDVKPLALAGIFGGLDSGVTASTSNIFLESAFFSPDLMLGKARAYGLHTDASHRYERGVDFSLQREAMERATSLLVDIVGGEIGDIVEAVASEYLPHRERVELRRERLDQLLGLHIPDDRVIDILYRLGLNPEKSDSGWTTIAPPFRFDIAIEEDLIEEVARVFGYNNIPTIAPQAPLKMLPSKESSVSHAKYCDFLLAQGFNEAITYSFVDPEIQKALFPEHDALTLPHPISVDMSVMRISILTGLLQTVAYNQKRKVQNVKLFENGLVFIPDDSVETGVHQYPMLAGVLAGDNHKEHWNKENRGLDFYDVKGVVDGILFEAGIDENVTYRRSKSALLHPGQGADIFVDDQKIGMLGAVHPSQFKRLGVSGNIFVFELILSALTSRSIPSAQPISKYPVNRRDLAFVVDEHLELDKLLKSIKKIGISEIVDINLFDVYQGQGVVEGKKSLALSLWLQSNEKTLEDDEMQATVSAVIQHLEHEFEATLRD